MIAHGSLIACVSSPVESSVADFSTCGLISSSFIFSYISFPIGGIFKDEIPEYPFCPEILEVPKNRMLSNENAGRKHLLELLLYSFLW